MNHNSNYYNENAAVFFSATASLDLSLLHARFLARVKKGGRILDAGCGSGRDAKVFLNRGFDVTAFDSSPELARLASAHCGISVQCRSFADVDEAETYDGIWACASLLHVQPTEMSGAMARLWNALRPEGTFFFCFKLGEGQQDRDGRSFTDANEPQIRRWLASLQSTAFTEIWTSPDERPGRDELWINALVTKAVVTTRNLVTGGSHPFLPYLSRAVSASTEIAMAVSFIKALGIQLLIPDLHAALHRDGIHSGRPAKVRILTSDYLGITDPDALRLLSLLQQDGAEVRVFVTSGDSFHLKAYLFRSEYTEGEFSGSAFIGSSNISRQALQSGLEWNYQVTYPKDAGFLEAVHQFEELFADPRTVALSDAWIDEYEKRRVPPPRAIAPGSDEYEPIPDPTAVQRQALDALNRTREQGFRRGLVVLATGLGKTWLAAFDVASVGAQRVLFVAHREEILNQAAATFVKIRRGLRVGYYTGKAKDADVDILCASVQTLGRAAHLQGFSPQHFDYIVVDEFHHAAASTYRRLLQHFAPTFLLGLTATPDRTDQSDILSLCDDNLVFTCGLFEGIGHDLLAPFHYFGIFDESVDYREIPWRNGKFDPAQLSNKLATLARSRHAINEWRLRAQSKTLAFCVSIKHAEFMAEQFLRAGIKAAAVYSGSPLGRAESLANLDAGTLQIIFAVDLFNEGVDVPSIDTVMMLRPTESKVLFLQQLGRGLRRFEGKAQLVVLDFIGNHLSFLQKLPALFGIGATYKALAAFANAAEQKRLDLPDGCFVNFDLRIIDLLKSLDSDSISSEYQALRNVLGRRPTLAELYRSGASVQAIRRQFGSWFELVKAQDDLEPLETPIVENHRGLFRAIETTSMTKSFKMICLEAFLEMGGLSNPPTIKELAETSFRVLRRRPDLLIDVPQALRDLPDGNNSAWQRYWRENPLDAWIGGKGAHRDASFLLADGRFSLATPVAADDAAVLAQLMQEIVDYRLAAYEVRRSVPGSTSNVIPFPQRERMEVPLFPNLKIACGHFRTGRADSEVHVSLPASYGQLDPQRHFIARAAGNSMNGGKNPILDGDYLLLELVSPSKAGSITGSVMAIERPDDFGDHQYLLRVVTKSPAGKYVLKANHPDYEDMLATDEMKTLARLNAIVDPLDLEIGKSFPRESIAPLFGEVFNVGNWQAGHVVLGAKKAHVLLVTLNKQGRPEEHRYLDHWIDERTFHWQSQNSTGPTTSRGQQIIQHVAMGISIHLFVRESKLVGGKAGQFLYHGKVSYVSHEGSNPMSVTFAVQ